MRAARLNFITAALVICWAGLVGPPMLFAQINFQPAPVKICPICSHPIKRDIYIVEDKVTDQKAEICTNCVFIFPNCFRCGLPVNTNLPASVGLEDGRFLCPRDGKDIVRDDPDGLSLCEKTKDDLDRLLSRFIRLPENVEVSIIDRIHIQDLYKISGRDYSCPNTLGYFTAITNDSGIVVRQIRILGGVPPHLFKSTCAHEYTHAWVNQAISPERRKTLAKDAQEGFCEMVAHMLMNSQSDEAGKREILRNNYTRGQLALFIEAQNLFGFNDIAEWILHGEDAKLSAQDLARVRQVEMPAVTEPATNASPASTHPIYSGSAPARAYTKLVLQGLSWSRLRPLALINGQTLAPGDETALLLGTNKVRIRCLKVNQSTARVLLLPGNEERELSLGGNL